MGKTQRYQAAVLGHRKAAYPIGNTEKGYATRPPKPEHRKQSQTAELLRVHPWSACIYGRCFGTLGVSFLLDISATEPLLLPRIHP